MILRVLIADSMSPAYSTPARFMQSLVDAINLEWIRHGVEGGEVIEASYVNGTAFIDTKPGRKLLTINDVRKACGSRF